MVSQLLKNSKALTLTELLIVTILLGVFMVGVASFDFAFKQAAQVSSDSSFEAMKISAAMLYISKDAALAIGNARDPGVVPSAGTNTYIYFRQDDATPNSFTLPTPNPWIAYKFDAATNRLNRCTTADASGGPNPVCVGTVDTVLNSVVAANFTLVTASPNFYLDVAITTRAKPALATNAMTNRNHEGNNHIELPAHTW